jgi:pyruvate formate lyase activating enzyme
MVRIPIIPGVNDDPEYLEILKKFLTDNRTNSIKRINLLPFHKTGASKYNKFNIPYRMKDIEPPDREKMQMLKESFEETGIKVKIGG